MVCKMHDIVMKFSVLVKFGQIGNCGDAVNPLPKYRAPLGLTLTLIIRQVSAVEPTKYRALGLDDKIQSPGSIFGEGV